MSEAFTRLRTWPAIALGVAALTLLLAFAGLGTLGENRKLREDLIRLTEQQRERETMLDDLARDLYISAILFRDLLLETDQPPEGGYRAELRNRRSAMMTRLQSYKRSVSKTRGSEHETDLQNLERLKAAAEDYWRLIAPFVDSVEGGQAAAPARIRDEVRKQRMHVAQITEEIARVDRDSASLERETLLAAVAERTNSLRRNFVMALVLGTAAIGSAWWRLSWLQRRARAVGQQHVSR
jgi:hypothetical protein